MLLLVILYLLITALTMLLLWLQLHIPKSQLSVMDVDGTDDSEIS